MATATFNTVIESPSINNGKGIQYDLGKIITTDVTSENEVTYRLSGQEKAGITLVDSILTIEYGAYGTISVLVTGDKTEATATTKVYGFQATKAEFYNDNKELTTKMALIKTNWSTFLNTRTNTSSKKFPKDEVINK